MKFPIFLDDDFYKVTEKIHSRNLKTFNLVTASENEVTVPDFGFSMQSRDIHMAEYTNNDAGDGPLIRELISKNLIESECYNDISLSNITLAPSITSASLNVLMALSGNDVSDIYLSTPCYYATKFQIEKLGLNVKLIPTYRKENFSLKLNGDFLKSSVLWITHPIISLTQNFNFNVLFDWVENNNSSKKKFLIIDEAADYQPMHIFDEEYIRENNVEIIRLRSYFKPLSVNGQRFSYIIASHGFTKEIAKWVWSAHGGLDQFSIYTAKWAIQNAEELKNLSFSVHHKCSNRKLQIDKLIRGTDLSLPNFENGYISSICVDMTKWKIYRQHGHFAARNALIDSLANIGIIPTLASSMYFAHENGCERIRIGYLGMPELQNKYILKLIDQLSFLR